MERLTTEFEGYFVPKETVEIDEYNITAECMDCWEVCENAKGTCSQCAIQHCFDKLAAYEDAEEAGLLFRAPCKIGDTIFVKCASHCRRILARAEVVDFTHFISCGFCAVVVSKFFDKQSIPFAEFGKTAFTTCEEAEAALQEWKESQALKEDKQ